MKGRKFTLPVLALLLASTVVLVNRPQEYAWAQEKKIAIVGADTADAPAAAGGLSEAEFAELLKDDIAYLNESLGQNETILKRTRSSMFSTAMQIAYNAQNQMKTSKTPEQLATLRDAALAVGKSLSDKEFDAAKKLAAELKMDMAANPKAGKEPIQIKGTHAFELYDLMSPFRLERAGGRNLEANLRGYKSLLRLRKPEEARIEALRVIPMAELTHAFAPDRKEGEKDPADWKKWTAEMKEHARAAVDALTKGDKKTATKAFSELDASCTKCHNVFRDS